jgi:flavodoxin
MAKVLGFFGSTGGNTELVMDKVAEVLESKGHGVELRRVEEAQPEDMKDHDLYILASPTYGHGTLQYHFQEFADKLEKQDLSDKKFAVIGLGDQRYEKEYLLEAAKILEALVKKQGGKLVQMPLRVLNAPIQHIDTLINGWAEQLSEKL